MGDRKNKEGCRWRQATMSEAQYQAKVVEVSPNSGHRVLLKNSIEQTCKCSLQLRMAWTDRPEGMVKFSGILHLSWFSAGTLNLDIIYTAESSTRTQNQILNIYQHNTEYTPQTPAETEMKASTPTYMNAIWMNPSSILHLVPPHKKVGLVFSLLPVASHFSILESDWLLHQGLTLAPE